MTITVFSGGAGCGKTHQLMQRLAEAILATPLRDGQKVLALTFMHGARRRLAERLATVAGLGQRYECATLDSFAARVVRRWRSLAEQLGAQVPEETAYEETVEVAALLLTQPQVVQWVKASFPILVLDEAQDLTRSRLDIIKGLATELTALIAADEFQCLKESLRPNPAWEWLRAQEDHMALEKPMRTNVTALLDAASALREGSPVKAGRGFSVHCTPKPAMAGGFLNTYIAGLKGNGLAVITPTVKNFSESVITWTTTRSNSKGRGPYPVKWEQAEARMVEAAVASIALADNATLSQAHRALAGCDDRALSRELAAWLDRLERTSNESVITKDALAERIQMICANRRRFQSPRDHGLRAMSVHGAKNREFDNVVVLWPAAVVGDSEHQRRLLYNAVTRARFGCLVLAQLPKQLTQSPFA